jgi:outer membrane protein insertion porin family
MKIRKATPFWAALFFALFATFGPHSIAQENDRPTVKAIDIQYSGAATVSRERILANMRTAVGRPYSDIVVEEDIRNLYASGVVENVRIFGEPSDGGVRVIVVVQTKAAIGEILVEGSNRIGANRIRKTITSKVGSTLSEATLAEDRQKILELYRNKNYPDTGVTYRTEPIEGQEKARVIFTIAEGGRISIRRIGFEGNTVFKDGELKKVISSKTSNLLSFVTKAGRLENEKLDQDAVALREHYQNAGYIDAVVKGPEINPVGEGKAEVLFIIEEGRPYKVGRVEIVGAQTFTADELRAGLKTVDGGVLSPKALRDDAKRMQDQYGTRGYIDMQVLAETLPAGDGVIDVNFRLEEGTQSYLERVNITGNTRTKDKVIRRELAVSPGEVYNSVLVDASKQRLTNLNYFSRVETYPSETMVPGRKDLNIVVEEKRTGAFNFGAGFSSIDNLIGFAEIQQSNFDITRPWSFTGGGQRFRLRVQLGTQRQDFILSLTEPYFLDYQFSLGGELFYRSANFVSSVYSQRNAGFALNARKPLGTYTSLQLGYRIEQVGIFDVDDDASETIQDEAGNYMKSSLTARVTYDTRDSLFLTRKGRKVDFTAYGAGGPLGGDVQIYGFDLEASQYFHLAWDTVLLINGQLATVDSFGGGGVPIFDRLYAGGAFDLRGFNYRDVSPKDEDGEPIGGRTLARMTVEYTFPVIERVRGAVFYDVGMVNSGAYDFGGGNVNSDVGFGVRIDLPIGVPIRLDYGIPLQADEFNDSSGRFNFNIGYQF